MIEYDESEECNYQYVVIEVDKNKAKLSRDELMAILHAENVLARRYFFPGCHKMEPYRSYYPHAGYLLPVSEMKSQMVMSLPTGVAVSEEDIEKVCDIIDYSVRNGEAISSMLKELESGLKFTVPLSDTR